MKRFMVCLITISLVTVAFTASAAQKPSNRKISFSSLHQEKAAVAAPASAENDLAVFFSDLRQELEKPKNSSNKNSLLLQAMEKYRDISKNFQTDCHFQYTSYLIDCFKSSWLDVAVYDMVVTPFFKLEKVSPEKSDKIRMTLEAGFFMSGVRGPADFDNIGRKRDAGIKALYRVRDCPQASKELRQLTSTAILKDYHCVTFAQQLEVVRQALKEALALIGGNPN